MPTALHSQDLLRPDQIHAIGLIVCEWSLLEAHNSVGIWQMLGVNREQGLAVTADLGASARIDMFTTLCRLQFSGDSEALKGALDLTARMKEANGWRNDTAHNIWRTESEADALQTRKFTARGGTLKTIPKTLTTDELMERAVSIGTLADDLLKWQRKHHVAAPQ